MSNSQSAPKTGSNDAPKTPAPDFASPAPQQNTRGNLANTGKHAWRALFSQIAGGMAQHHMRNFVRDHAGKLRFILGSLNSAQVDEDSPARQSKSIDIGHLDHVELVGPAIAGCILHQLVAKLLDVFGNRARIG